MQFFAPFLLILSTVTTAQAHPSIVAHDHPHGPSALADLNWYALGIVAVMLTFLVAIRARRR
jgi:hypothetical protein